MENDVDKFEQEIIIDQPMTMARHFVANVFSWMFLGLVITGVVSWYSASGGWYESLMSDGGGMNMMGWVVMLSPFAFIIAMNSGLQRFSSSTLILLFIGFSIVMGISLAWIFYAYSLGSIVSVFGITALTFGTMAVLGYTTNTDLTKFGSILLMALIGLIIASVVNMFMHSGFMDYVISMIGVLIFTGLTAYDTQRMKRIGAGIEYGSEDSKKLAILGATSLYLNFLNLFLFLLRIMGGRD